jgi:hypothetical protein
VTGNATVQAHVEMGVTFFTETEGIPANGVADDTIRPLRLNFVHLLMLN